MQLLVVNIGSSFTLKTGHTARRLLALKNLPVSFLSCSVFLSENNGEILEHARGFKGSSVFLVHVTGQSSAYTFLISSVSAQVFN